MAPETYYFFFSILLVSGPGVYLTNMAYYRIKGKNIIGRKFKPGTVDYDLMQKHSSNFGLIILSAITVLGIANLIFDIYRILHLPNQDDARFLLVFAPVFTAVIGTVVAIKIRKQLGDEKN